MPENDGTPTQVEHFIAIVGDLQAQMEVLKRTVAELTHRVMVAENTDNSVVRPDDSSRALWHDGKGLPPASVLSFCDVTGGVYHRNMWIQRGDITYGDNWINISTGSPILQFADIANYGPFTEI